MYVHKNLPAVSLEQVNPIHTLSLYFLNIHFNINPINAQVFWVFSHWGFFQPSFFYTFLRRRKVTRQQTTNKIYPKEVHSIKKEGKNILSENHAKLGAVLRTYWRWFTSRSKQTLEEGIQNTEKKRCNGKGTGRKYGQQRRQRENQAWEKDIKNMTSKNRNNGK